MCKCELDSVPDRLDGNSNHVTQRTRHGAHHGARGARRVHGVPGRRRAAGWQVALLPSGSAVPCALSVLGDGACLITQPRARPPGGGSGSGGAGDPTPPPLPVGRGTRWSADRGARWSAGRGTRWSADRGARWSADRASPCVALFRCPDPEPAERAKDRAHALSSRRVRLASMQGAGPPAGCGRPCRGTRRRGPARVAGSVGGGPPATYLQ